MDLGRRLPQRQLLLLACLAPLLPCLPPPPPLSRPTLPDSPIYIPERALSPLEPPPPPPPAITDVKNPRCSDYICSIEMCLPIEDCDGEVHHNATECGCCPLCIKYLDEGRACGRHGVLRFPEKPTTMCRPTLQCVDGYCVTASLPRRGARPALDDTPAPTSAHKKKRKGNRLNQIDD